MGNIDDKLHLEDQLDPGLRHLYVWLYISLNIVSTIVSIRREREKCYISYSKISR